MGLVLPFAGNVVATADALVWEACGAGPTLGSRLYRAPIAAAGGCLYAVQGSDTSGALALCWVPSATLAATAASEIAAAGSAATVQVPSTLAVAVGSTAGSAATVQVPSATSTTSATSATLATSAVS